MKKMASGEGVLSAVALALIVQLYSCKSDDGSTAQTENTELTEYEGTGLTPIEEFPTPGIHGVQTINIENYKLEVTGLVENAKSYTYNEVINNFSDSKKIVTLYCVDGWDITFLCEGISVIDLIEASAPLDDVNTVIFHAKDKYTTSMPYEEVMAGNLLAAYKVNNIDIPMEIGFPFRLVVEGKFGYKWIKWLTKIELSSDNTYRGYWESQGYSNSGDME